MPSAGKGGLYSSVSYGIARSLRTKNMGISFDVLNCALAIHRTRSQPML